MNHLPDVTVGEFGLKPGHRCRVSLSTFKGRPRCDVRVFYEDVAEWRPSKQGVNLSTDDLPMLRKLIVEAEAKAIDAGVLDPADHTDET